MNKGKVDNRVPDSGSFQLPKLFFIITMILLISGCAIDPALRNQITWKIKNAEENLKKAGKLDVEKKYVNSSERAEKELDNARTFLKEEKGDEALQSADSGLNISKEILKPFAADKIEDAQKNLDAAENMDAEKRYVEDSEKAKKELTDARSFLEKAKTKEAFEAAGRSLSKSKEILREHFVNEVKRRTLELRGEIIDKAGTDKDSPLLNYLPELNAILDYAEDLETGRQDASLDKVLANLDKFLGLKYSVSLFESGKLESDISFRLGEYELSEAGKIALEEKFLIKIISNKDKCKEKYPDSAITIKITVYGYTDQVGFNEGKPLFRKLSEGVEHALPKKQPERRKFLNQRLSELRAQAIGDYIRQRILETERGGSRVRVEPKIEGMGELIPEDIVPSGLNNDPKRRVCKIYSEYTAYREQ